MTVWSHDWKVSKCHKIKKCLQLVLRVVSVQKHGCRVSPPQSLIRLVAVRLPVYWCLHEQKHQFKWCYVIQDSINVSVFVTLLHSFFNHVILLWDELLQTTTYSNKKQNLQLESMELWDDGMSTGSLTINIWDIRITVACKHKQCKDFL